MKKELSTNAPHATAENNISSFMKIKPRYSTDDYTGNGRLTDKYVVVTASDNGVGKAVSIAFAKEGADIIMVYNHQKHEKDLRDILKIIEKIGRKVWLFKSGTFEVFKCRKLFENIIKKGQTYRYYYKYLSYISQE